MFLLEKCDIKDTETLLYIKSVLFKALKTEEEG